VFDELLQRAGRVKEQAEELSILEEAISYYQGDFLQGIYADWTTLDRERLRMQYLVGMEKLAGLYSKNKKYQRSIELYQRILKQDPYRETTHRALILDYYNSGDRAAAIRHYNLCVSLLEHELGVNPAEDTKALFKQITN
jgi:DNA-binding SARP family transcriptional activator